MLRFAVLFALAMGVVSCDDNTVNTSNGVPNQCYDGGCQTSTLPLVGGADAPSLLAVKLECQDHAVVVLATADDPQGGANLHTVLQTIGVYPDKDCLGAALTVQDNFVDVGVEESFGDAVVRMNNPTLYDRICGCNSWPVQAQLEDVDGNATSGRVVANVIYP